MTPNLLGLSGVVSWVLRAESGDVVAEGETHNLITRVGDQMYGERGAGIGAAPAAPTGMKLGSGSAAVTKVGAGAALATYLTNSHQAFDSGFPASELISSTRKVTYRTTFPAGKATTASPITEVVIVNSALADSTSPAANTIARALLTGIPSKGASETLEVTWAHNLLGA